MGGSVLVALIVSASPSHHLQTLRDSPLVPTPQTRRRPLQYWSPAVSCWVEKPATVAPANRNALHPGPGGLEKPITLQSAG